MQTSDNFDLKVYEGTDLFNPLTVENANIADIDEQMYKNQNAGLQTATELLAGTVHEITRSVEDAAAFRFTAVSRFTAGDTFTVDGVQVSALTTSGEQIPDGAFIIGSEVVGVLKGTLLTLYISMTKAASAKDAEKLGGVPAADYGLKADVEAAQETATAAGTLAGQNQTAIAEINESLGKLNATKLGTLKVANEVVTLTGNISNYKYILFLYDDGGMIRGTHLIPVNLFTTVNKVQFTYLYGTQTKYDVIHYVSDNQMKEEIANGWTYVYGISF